MDIEGISVCLHMFKSSPVRKCHSTLGWQISYHVISEGMQVVHHCWRQNQAAIVRLRWRVPPVPYCRPTVQEIAVDHNQISIKFPP